MKIIDLAQGSKDWHAWRKRGLGATAAPVIMNEGKFVTPFQLWLECTGLGTRPEPNAFQVAAMERGNRLEPIARMKAEDALQKQFVPICVEHDDYPHIRASLDGWNWADADGLELKAPNKLDHAKAVAGKVPKHYWGQVQAQMLITGAKRWYYGSLYEETGPLAIVEIVPDVEYQTRLLAEMLKFWQLVQTQTPPELCEEDINALKAAVIFAEAKLRQAQNALKYVPT
jgi:putative phage-type endonuclease